MKNVTVRRHLMQAFAGLACCCIVTTSFAEESAKPKFPDAAENPKVAEAKTVEEMKAYSQTIPGTTISFDMVPISGGEYLMGSPADEPGREEDEGPQVKVKVSPFWMGRHEITWNEYEIWNLDLDVLRREKLKLPSTDRDKLSDAVTRPTKPYTDMTFNSGHDGFPATGMTPLAAQMYCKWLSAKTGHYYRLPTEAEWEFAARGGTTTAYSFGDDPAKLGDYAWYVENSGLEREVNYHKIGLKKPNPFGLYDMHGNVAEYCLDEYDADWYQRLAKLAKGNNGVIINPLNVPRSEEGRVVRGGSWTQWYDGDPEYLRSASRFESMPEDWKIQDPQIPQSVWYYTDGTHVGFRIVRPLTPPSEEERLKLKLDPVVPEHARFLQRAAN